MSECMFLGGEGHLGKKAAKIAIKFGAELVNYNDCGCKCGYGCNWDCPATARHWFVTENRGSPFDDQVAEAVLSALKKARIKGYID